MRPGRARIDPQKSLVGFVVGDIRYAIDIGAVLQIVQPLELAPLPHLPEGIVGVADYRGDVVPVVDMRARFGLPPVPATRRTKWIIATVGEQAAALVVDGVTDVFGTRGAELRPAPGLGGDDRRGILGVTSQDSQMTFVLDVERLRPMVESVTSGLRPSAAVSRGIAPRHSLVPAGPRGHGA
jgi:purine-binding chemotaxis protein CheW